MLGARRQLGRLPSSTWEELPKALAVKLPNLPDQRQPRRLRKPSAEPICVWGPSSGAALAFRRSLQAGLAGGAQGAQTQRRGEREEEGIRAQIAGPKVAGGFVPCFSLDLSAAFRHGGNLARGSVTGKAGSVRNLR